MKPSAHPPEMELPETDAVAVAVPPPGAEKKPTAVLIRPAIAMRAVILAKS